MNGKKVNLVLVSIVFMILFSTFVSAVTHDTGVGDGLKSAFETIRDLFGFLPQLITMEGLLNEDPGSIFWAKFLVWLFLFVVVYFGATAIPKMKENNRIAVVVAIVISLMSALMIPNGILVNIFQTYGLVAGLIIWLIPVVAGMYIAHLVKERFLKALIYAIAIGILAFINVTVVKEGGFFNTSFPYFSLLMAVLIFMFFWNLVGMGFGTDGQRNVAGWLGDRGRNAFDWLNRDPSEHGLFGGRGPQDRENRDERRERERQLRELNQRLDNARRGLANQIRGQRGHEVADLIAIANLINELIQIEAQMRAVVRPQQGGGG